MRHLRENPSLKSQLDQATVDAHRDALIEAERETGLAADTFPDVCPSSFDETISDDFWPAD
jgi:hypothetical protein